MKKGFTLIEILVVIALIGVLAGFLIVSFQGVRRSARDGKRKADLEQIRAGLEMCRQQSAARSYPVGTNYLTGCTSYVPDNLTDPLSSAGYSYVYSGATTTYTLCAYLEGEGASIINTGNCTSSCTGCSSNTPSCNYLTCNP